MKKDILEKWLINRLAREIGLEPQVIGKAVPLYHYLMNGFQSFGVVADLEKSRRRKLSPSILYELQTISGLAKY